MLRGRKETGERKGEGKDREPEKGKKEREREEEREEKERSKERRRRGDKGEEGEMSCARRRAQGVERARLKKRSIYLHDGARP